MEGFFQNQKPLFNDLDFNTTIVGSAYNYPINVTWFMFQNEYSYPNFDKILNFQEAVKI